MNVGKNEFWESRFGKPACAKNYHYYGYEYLDDLSFMRLASEVFAGWPHASELIENVSGKLKELGWEGDGEFQVMWFPPFAGAGEQDHFGTYCLHVKQKNDGISWIVSPVTLPFHRLFQPDNAKYPRPSEEDPIEKPQRKGMVRWLSDFFQ
jgi:hypothetical protein